MTSIFERLRGPVDALRVTREKNLDRLRSLVAADGKTLNWTREPDENTPSLAEIEARLLLIEEVTIALLKESETGLTPRTLVSQLQAALEQLVNHLNSAASSIDQLVANGNAATVPDDQASLTSKGGQAGWNLAKWLRGVSNNADAVLQHWIPIASSRETQSQITGATFLNEHERIIAKNRADSESLRVHITSAQEQLRAIDANRNASETSVKAAATSRDEAEKSRKVINDYEAEATQKIATIREVGTQSDTLAAAVQAYQKNFEQFQQALEAREKRLAEGDSQHADLIQRLEAKIVEIDRLTSTAEQMLTGATVAGLASAFGKMRDDLTKEVRLARLAFYGAIVLLIICAMPLAVYVLPGFSLGSLFGEVNQDGPIEIGQVLVRLVLLVPALWLAKFTAARHAALFRLREHYAYKYSIAASVEGFKKQAPELKEGIAAAAFHALTFNPADRMEAGGAAQEHPNPIMDWFLRKIGATADGKSQ